LSRTHCPADGCPIWLPISILRYIWRLRGSLKNLLAKSRRALTARELADQVLASGYQTKSKNFMEVMWVALSQMKNIKKVPDKGYILKR
jgi:hypothetical protein